MIKGLIILILIMLVLCDVSAIRINEVEMNPLGGSTEKEWIEIYNNETEEVDISNWTIYDGLSSPKKIYTFPNETKINAGEFYIAEINKSSLNNDNNGDFVTLYNNSHQKIDETEILKDTSQSLETHQFCSSSWKFMSSTKGSENNCTEQIVEPLEENISINNSQQTTETNNTPSTKTTKPNNVYNPQKSTTKAITLDMIDLNSKDIKSGDNKEILKKNLALGGIVTFCVGFGALFLLKFAGRKKENEFR